MTDNYGVALLHLADFLAVGGQAVRAGNVSPMPTRSAAPVWPFPSSGTAHGLIYEASVANARTAHVLDWDDLIIGVPTHPGTIIWPALLAVAPEGTTVRQLCSAFLEGVGVAREIAACVGPEHYRRGWHATTTVGRIAAAYAAATVLYGDPGLAWTAMQLSTMTVSGFNDVFGTSAKAVQVGLACGAATHAALLVTSVPDMPDVLLPTTSAGKILGVVRKPERRERYASDSVLTSLRVKQFPCCYFAHAPVLAALDLVDRAKEEPTQTVVLEVSESAARVCSVVLPNTIDEARFSLNYLVASALSGYSDGALGLVNGSVLSSTAVADLATRIHVTVRPELADMAAAVRIGDHRVALNLEEPAAGVSATSVAAKSATLSIAMRDLIGLCLSDDPSSRARLLDSPFERLFLPTETT